ncbi:phosphotransferase, partial [Mycobacterium sp. ITM-2017-0098]
IAPEHRYVCERLIESFDAHMAAENDSVRTRGLVHGDFRLDNMLFGQEGADRPLTVVDWQTVTWGPAFTDVAYFLGCALPIEQRRD